MISKALFWEPSTVQCYKIVHTFFQIVCYKVASISPNATYATLIWVLVHSLVTRITLQLNSPICSPSGPLSSANSLSLSVLIQELHPIFPTMSVGIDPAHVFHEPGWGYRTWSCPQEDWSPVGMADQRMTRPTGWVMVYNRERTGAPQAERGLAGLGKASWRRWCSSWALVIQPDIHTTSRLQLFIEHLLCMRHFARCWGYNTECNHVISYLKNPQYWAYIWRKL